MGAKAKSSVRNAGKWHWGADVPLAAIRRFARQVAKQFQPEKIILFGSYAYGKPTADSDVDILVVMRCRNVLDQAVKISMAIDPPFPLDIIVRTPYAMQWRLKEGDWYLREITSKGKTLYEEPHQGVGAKGRRGLRRGSRDRSRKKAVA